MTQPGSGPARGPEGDGPLGAGRRPALHGVPDYIWTPLAAGGLVLFCGFLGLAFYQPWLFPSIGPTAFLLAHSPHQAASRSYNVVVGHLAGLVMGYVAVFACGATSAPALFPAGELEPARVWASALAVALTLALQIGLRASHPPAAATTLLVSLGGFKPTAHDAFAVVAGVVLVAVAGRFLRPMHGATTEAAATEAAAVRDGAGAAGQHNP